MHFTPHPVFTCYSLFKTMEKSNKDDAVPQGQAAAQFDPPVKVVLVVRDNNNQHNNAAPASDEHMSANSLSSSSYFCGAGFRLRPRSAIPGFPCSPAEPSHSSAENVRRGSSASGNSGSGRKRGVETMMAPFRHYCSSIPKALFPCGDPSIGNSSQIAEQQRVTLPLAGRRCPPSLR